MPRLALRWTIGDVSDEGFQALALAVWGARRLFGTAASYTVCVNTVPLSTAQSRAGELPPEVAWIEVTARLPAFLSRHLDETMAEGVAWKFAPLRLYPDAYELCFDNDLILWSAPAALSQWVQGPGPACLLAQDVCAAYGRFAASCPPGAFNAGIRGLPPGFDYEAALQKVLGSGETKLVSELDEQGLQVAALSLPGPPAFVPLEDVTVCSPFPPHLPYLGKHGAHFCGLNARDLGWRLEGRRASDIVRAFWQGHLPTLRQRLGRAPAPAAGRGEKRGEDSSC